MSARVYQAILTSSFTQPLRGAVSGFGADLLWVAALGCRPDWCRQMNTHIHHLRFKPGFTARPQFPLARPQSLGYPNTYVWVSPHSLTFDQTDYSLNRDWTEHHVHCGFHYQVWFHVSAGMTHSLGSEYDLERYLFNSMLRIVFLNSFLFPHFFHTSW